MTVHVVFVVVWVGGGAILTILGIRAERATDNAELVAIARQAAFLGQQVFAPAAIVVVAMGIAMVSNKDIGFNHFWIAFGLLGFLIDVRDRDRRARADVEEARRAARGEGPGRTRSARPRSRRSS